MGKMKELIEYADNYENAVNYIVSRDSDVSIEGMLGLSPNTLSFEERVEILDRLRTEYYFAKGHLRRFVEKNPEYKIVNEIDIITPSGKDTGDCVTAEDFVAFCRKN